MIFKNEQGNKLAITFKTRYGQKKQYYIVPACRAEAENKIYEYDEELIFAVPMALWDALLIRCSQELFFSLFDYYFKTIGRSEKYVETLQLFARA